MREQYVNIEGKWVRFESLPCAKCRWRYGIHCPRCKWNANGQYDTYGGRMMTAEEAEKLNKEASK